MSFLGSYPISTRDGGSEFGILVRQDGLFHPYKEITIRTLMILINPRERLSTSFRDPSDSTKGRRSTVSRLPCYW